MEQPHMFSIPSLLPYLQGSGQNIVITLVNQAEDAASPIKYSSPFFRDSTIEPLSRITYAQLRTDAGSVISDILLLSRQDQHHMTGQRLWPLNNIDVDTAWQELFSSGSRRKRIELSCQIDGSGRFNKLSSLFYCNHTLKYFIPPCPGCGSPLQLCEDDELLTGCGLPAYSTSLQRYLYCPDCCRQNGGEFFAYEIADTDPACVSDRFGLIKGFRGGAWTGGGSSLLPCATCAGRDDCFGAGGEYLFRLLPVFFYPAGVLIYERPLLKAVDFLPLVSGQPREQWKKQVAGRAFRYPEVRTQARCAGDGGNDFYFRDRPEFFLEILYLKLSLLGDVIAKLLADFTTTRHFCDLLSFERIWVDFAELGSLLPSCWTFSLTFIDELIPKYRSVHLHKNVSDEVPVNLGVLWFEVMLSNNRQDRNTVIRGLELLCSGNGGDSDFTQLVKSEPLFQPGNIFWDPRGEQVTPAGLLSWEKALNFGASLLLQPDRFRTSASYKMLYDGIMALGADVKSAMMSGAGNEGSNESARGPENKGADFSEVLRVIELMRSRLLPQLGSKQETDEREEVSETVVLMSGQHAAMRGAAPIANQPVAQKELAPTPPPELEYETSETLVLEVRKPAGTGGAEPPALPPRAVREGGSAGADAAPAFIDDACETVILSGGRQPQNKEQIPPVAPSGQRRNMESSTPSDVTDALSETIVLAPRSPVSADIEAGKSIVAQAAASAPSQGVSSAEDQLDATIILPSRPRIPTRRG